ncbi:MAG: DUF5711 family protein [Eubacteriales bacterium]|nr:DUF5711 family protein [Eubacteriales bacterium]
MSNGNSSRETQKRKLKRQVIDAAAEERTEGHFVLRRVLPVAVLLAVLIAAGIYFYFSYRVFDTLETVWEKETQEDGGSAESFRGYELFAKGFLRYSKDGASYVNGDGRTIWERSYQMQNPIAAVNGNYAAIADQGAQSIYIFSDSANTGVASTVLPVSRITISRTGVVYAILKDDRADYITAFKADGSGIDLSIKSIITGDGYPIDIAVSPDGTELLTSYAAIENSQVVQKVIFRNFDEVGKAADARRVVGGFTEEFDGHLVGRVNFSTNEYSQAYYDGGIAFFSTKVLTSPELLFRDEFEEEINSIAYSDKYVAVILNTNGGEMPYRLVIYKVNGGRLAETLFNFAYTGFEIDGNEILLYNESGCRVYDIRGRERVSADFPMQVSVMRKSGFPGEYLLGGQGRLMKVKMR